MRSCVLIEPYVNCGKKVGEGQQTLEGILEQVPVKESDWPEDLRADLGTFRDLQKSEVGLIPNASCPAIFGVTRQRWDAMCQQFMFKKWKLFGKWWFSQKQLEEFSKLDRKEMRGGPKSKNASMMRMIKETLADAHKDDE